MTKATQKKIAEKAGALMRVHGYEGTSINDIVGKAGVSKGAFFHYYPNKQAISQQVIDSYVETQLIGPLNKHLMNTDNVREGLLKWVEEFFETFKAHGFQGGCLLGNMALELSDQNDAARESIKTHFLNLENTLVSYLKPLGDENRLLMEPRQFARLLISALQGATMLAKVHKDNIRASREFLALGFMIRSVIRD